MGNHLWTNAPLKEYEGRSKTMPLQGSPALDHPALHAHGVMGSPSPSAKNGKRSVEWSGARGGAMGCHHPLCRRGDGGATHQDRFMIAPDAGEGPDDAH